MRQGLSPNGKEETDMENNRHEPYDTTSEGRQPKLTGLLQSRLSRMPETRAPETRAYDGLYAARACPVRVTRPRQNDGRGPAPGVEKACRSFDFATASFDFAIARQRLRGRWRGRAGKMRPGTADLAPGWPTRGPPARWLARAFRSCPSGRGIDVRQQRSISSAGPLQKILQIQQPSYQ